MSKSKKKKSNIFKDNKKELIILAILIVLALIAVLFERSYALDDKITGSDSNQPTETETTSNAAINYAEDSDIKSSDKAQVGNTAKYKISYKNTNPENANAAITITLNQGFEYVTDSSTIGEPIVVTNDDNSKTLTWNREVNAGASENFTIEVNVTKNIDCNIIISGLIVIGGAPYPIPELVNDVEDFTITYISDEYGAVEDATETKKYEENPSGRTSVPNEGYKFKEWNCDKKVTLTDGTTIEPGSPITGEQVKQIKVTEDITLTAIHEENEPEVVKYTVTYVDGYDPVIDPFEVDEGTKITLIELPEKEGYTPVEWKIDGTSYNPGSEVTITKDTTIEVVYTRDQTEKQSYTVIYKFDGTDIESTTVAEGSKIKIKALPTKTGCEVKKWTINGEEVSVGDEIEIAANTTIITTSICSSEDMKEESSKTENTTEEIVVEKEKSNVTPSSTESTKVNASRYKNSKVLNPKTGDRIMTYILIAGVSLIVIIALLIILNLKNKKEKKEDKENK